MIGQAQSTTRGDSTAGEIGMLPLDELKEIDATKIGTCVYMLAKGSGKARRNQGGANRRRHEWRVLFLSSGEISVQDHIREGNGKTHAGHEVRVPDIPSNPGAGHGIVESLHGQSVGKAQTPPTCQQNQEIESACGFTDDSHRQRDCQQTRKTANNTANSE